MNPSALADALDQITGSWRPSAAARPDDLAIARERLAAALTNGISPGAMRASPVIHSVTTGGNRPAIDAIVKSISSEPALTIFPHVRSATDIDPANASSVAGMKVDKTLGPFIDRFGVLHWVDLIPLSKKIPISSDTFGEIGFLIVELPTGPVLPAGSLWVAAAALHVPSLTTGAVGVSFSSATVKTTGSVTFTGGGVVIGAGGTLTLNLTLAPPTASPGTPPLGADARSMTLALPPKVIVEFAEAGAAFVSIDDSSATVYDTSFSLKRNAASPRVETIGIQYVVFPCNVSISEFSFKTVLSSDVAPSGQAPVVSGGWGLPITTAPPAQLGAVDSAGSLILRLGTGLSLQFGNLSAPTQLANATLALAPGDITISATNGTRSIKDTLTLWNPAPTQPSVQPSLAQHASEIDLTIGRGSTLFAIVATNVEATIALGSARVNADRPLAANGSRLRIAFNVALAGFVHFSTVQLAIVEMSGPPGSTTIGPPPRWAVALENALLTVQPPESAICVAALTGGQSTGFLELLFGKAAIMPILPDPYASANALPLPVSGSVAALAAWTLKPGASLNFSIIAASQQSSSTSDATTSDSLVGRQYSVAARGATTLLDLSSNVDQFGISIELSREGARSIELAGLMAVVPQQQLEVYTLPGISWEPVVDDSTQDWYDAPTSNDGPPTRLLANTVQLVPTRPDFALASFTQAAADANTLGQFTLPFGLIATLEVTSDTTAQERPNFSLITANYPGGLSAAHQLSIQAQGPQASLPTSTAALPGNMTTGSTFPIPPGQLTYGGMILDDTNPNLSAASFVEQQFSLHPPPGSLNDPEVPVSRIDISGYGTSMFSEWANPDITKVDVTRARFDVLVGRTAYELVQIQSIILPWSVRITETVIFERYDDGLVVRHNTGWKAVGDAKFETLGSSALTGAVTSLTNIHNILPTGGLPITLTADTPNGIRPLEFVPITFDADVVFQPGVTATAHGVTGKPVAATQILGYAQTTTGQVASAIETLAMMQRLPNGVSGSLGCILSVGPQATTTPAPAQFTLNATSITAKATSTTSAGTSYPAAVAVALYGTPRLPRDGAWSISRRASTNSAPTAVDPTSPIPLIYGSNNGSDSSWRLLDPSDALSVANPGTLFGLLQGTGTSKTLFENPIVQASGQALSLDPTQGVPPPNLADIGALLGAVDIFPDLSNVLQIPSVASDALQLVQDGFQKTFPWTIEQNDQKLLDLGIISLVLQYHGPDQNGIDQKTHATFTIDAMPPAGQPRWALKLEFLSLAVFVAGFGDDALLTIHGGFAASETQKAGFNNIQVDYGSALAMIKEILSGITTLVEAIGGSVDLDVGFSENKLTVHDGFALPTLPLGLGELEDIGIDLGLSIEIPKSASFNVGFASKENPFTWIVDPLAGNGAIVLGTADGDLGVYIEAGIGAALELNLAIASGGASIILEFSLTTKAPNIQICVALTGNANVDVLDGLASVSLTLTASIAVTPIFPPGSLLPNAVDFTGAVAVGIHLSIAWVISVDFDGSWSFSENIRLHLPI